MGRSDHTGSAESAACSGVRGLGRIGPMGGDCYGSGASPPSIGMCDCLPFMGCLAGMAAGGGGSGPSGFGRRFRIEFGRDPDRHDRLACLY